MQMLPALEACLAAAQRLAADRLAFLGDFVGYGPDPEDVINRVRPLVEAGAIAVLGNHDLAVLKATRDMNATAAEALAWTRAQLSEASKSFLAGLPFEVRSGDMLFVHADAANPAAWHYVTDVAAARASLSACSATVTFCGHVHVPAVYCLSSAGKMTAHAPVQGVEHTASAAAQVACRDRLGRTATRRQSGRLIRNLRHRPADADLSSGTL